MSLLGKIFGKKNGPAGAPLLTPPPAYPTPPGTPTMLKAWDDYGRICEIPRETWRTQVLPVNFQKTWNNPDQLAALINSALSDHFIPDALEPARQLHRIDPQPKRGALYLAVILLQLKKFDEAEQVITDTIRQHGEDGVLLTNLSKVYSGRGQNDLAEQTLWHALELDPNQDNGLLWYQAIHRDRDGEEAAQAAFQRVAALPGSWRAQLWLARAALQSRNLDRALELYQEVLSRIGKPVPTDLLQQMSGDLGNAAHLPELLRLTEPHFEATTHGLTVGNNLIKAHVDLAQFDAARKILDQLYALNRGDWKEHLSYWDTEIAKARLATVNAEPQKPLQYSLLTGDGPVWLKPGSPAAELFPAKTTDDVRVAFLCGSVERATNSQRTEIQLADTAGRLTRALPLFFAEQAEFHSRAHVQTLFPWIIGEVAGFALAGAAWTDEHAAQQARQGQVKNDYVVTTHLKTQAEPWVIELRLVRTIDVKCLGRLEASFPSAKPEDAIPRLAQQLIQLLADHAEVAAQSPPALYQVPDGPHFPYYLLRLEQLLAVRCSGMAGVQPEFLHGVREVVDGNLQQCLNCPQNVPARLLLVQTLQYLKKTRPEVVKDYQDKIERLQKEKPLPEPAHGVVQRMFNEVIE